MKPSPRPTLSTLGGALVVAALALLSSCATSTTLMTTGDALRPGDFQATVNYHLPFHTNLITSTLDSAEELENLYENNATEMTENELQTLLRGALSFGIFSTLGAPELILRAGVTEAILGGLEVGAKTNGSMAKGDVKVQLWGSEDGGSALALDLAYGYHFDVGPSLLSHVTLTDWSRHDLDVAVVVSHKSGDWFRAYLAPRVLASFVTAKPSISETLKDNLPSSVTETLDASQYFQDENLLYLGATAGIMLGYRWIFVNLELTVMHMDFDPKVIDEKQDMSGWLIAPSVGLTSVF